MWATFQVLKSIDIQEIIAEESWAGIIPQPFFCSLDKTPNLSQTRLFLNQEFKWGQNKITKQSTALNKLEIIK